MERNHWLLIASIAGATGVMAGAFGAHGLKDKVSPEMLAIFETGARYQLLHALALLGIAALSSTWNNRTLNLAGWAFTLDKVKEVFRLNPFDKVEGGYLQDPLQPCNDFQGLVRPERLFQDIAGFLYTSSSQVLLGHGGVVELLEDNVDRVGVQISQRRDFHSDLLDFGITEIPVDLRGNLWSECNQQDRGFSFPAEITASIWFTSTDHCFLLRKPISEDSHKLFGISLGVGFNFLAYHSTLLFLGREALNLSDRPEPKVP